MDLQALNKQELQKLFIDLHSEYLDASKDHIFGQPKTPEHEAAKGKLNEVLSELNNRSKKIGLK
jgi:hypothetical protein